MPPSQAEKRKKLYQLAHCAGVDLSEAPGKLCFTKSAQPFLVGRKDRYEASRLIGEVARKGRTLSILHRHAGLLPHVHKYEHVENALCDHVQNSGSAEVAQALIDCLRWAKKGDQRTRSPHMFLLPAGLLGSAVKAQHAELVRVLAPHALGKELNAALRAATEISDTTIQSILLQHGADINCLSDYLVQDITSNDARQVKTFLRQGRSLKPHVFEACIKSAIEVENMDALAFLLKTRSVIGIPESGGSRPGWNRDMLLHMAIQREQYDTFITLAYHTNNRPLYDESLYAEVVARCRSHPETALSMTEILLCLDASASCASKFWQDNSSPFDEGLVDSRLLWLLIHHEVPVSPHSFRLAAQTSQLNMFIKLLTLPVEDGNVAWEAARLLPTELQCVAREQIIVKLTKQKTKGDRWADRPLIYATVAGEIEWVRALLNKAGASPSYNNGEALKAAVERQHVSIFRLFMTRPFSEKVASELILLIRKLDKEARLSFMAALLKRAYPHSVITPLLDDFLSDRSESRDLDLIMKLIESEARCSDKGIIAIVNGGDVQVLHRFLAVHKRQVELLGTSTISGLPPHFVTSSMQFLVDRLPSTEKSDLREACLETLDVHIRQWTLRARGDLLQDYFDMLRTFEVGPVDSGLVNLFGKYQRQLSLSEQSKITGIIVCSQPERIASAFVKTFSLAACAAYPIDSIELKNLVHQVAGTNVSDDSAKTAKLSMLLSSCRSIFDEAEVSAECLELHTRSLARASHEHKWPTETTSFLLECLGDVDNRFYSALRIAAIYEQLETLDTLFSRVPHTQYIGGDLIRPLLRYGKIRSLPYLLRRGTPLLARQAFCHARNLKMYKTAAMIIEYGTVHNEDSLCGCLKGLVLTEDEDSIGQMVLNGAFDAKSEEGFWSHLDPQP